MMSLTITIGTGARQPIWNKITATFSKLRQTFEARRTRRRDLRALRSLDNRTLKDIGYHRSELMSLVANDEGDGTRRQR